LQLSDSPTPSSFVNEVKHSLRNRLFTGFVVLVPVGITIFAINFLYKITAGFIAPYIGDLLAWSQRLPDNKEPNGTAVTVISIVLFIALVYGVGLFTSFMLGKRLLALGESLIVRIPFVRTIYSASKRVIEFVSASNQAAFKSVVMVEFPRAGYKCLGFVTGTITNKEGQRWLKIFVPTAPNPTSGFLQIVRFEEAEQVDMSVEDAIKMIMSAGILTPDNLLLRSEPADTLPEQMITGTSAAEAADGGDESQE
jgi:uncharacterized membrane protein